MTLVAGALLLVWALQSEGRTCAVSPGHSGNRGDFGAGAGFAALLDDSSIVTWQGVLSGRFACTGPTCEDVPNGTGYSVPIATETGWFALDSDGQIRTWGRPWGTLGCGPVVSTVAYTAPPLDTGYVRGFSSPRLMAAIKGDGRLVAWGATEYLDVLPPTTPGWVADSVVHSQHNGAALDGDGRIAMWGKVPTTSGVDTYTPYMGAPNESGFKIIVPSISDFAAVKHDGAISVFAGRRDTAYFREGAPTGTGWLTVVANLEAFTAIKMETGEVHSWGRPSAGGSGHPVDAGYSAVFGGRQFFAGIKEHGHVSAWGLDRFRDEAPTDSGYVLVQVAEVNAYPGVMAALNRDGRITVWGRADVSFPGSDYVDIFAAQTALVALKSGGELVQQGSLAYNGGFIGGGQQSASVSPNDDGYVAVFSTAYSFAAVKAAGEVASWGTDTFGASAAPWDTPSSNVSRWSLSWDGSNARNCVVAAFNVPSTAPSSSPTVAPTTLTSAFPTATPTTLPSVFPTVVPTDIPSSAVPTAPSDVPTAAPSGVGPGSALGADSTDGSDDGISAGVIVGIVLALLLVVGIASAVQYRRMWLKEVGAVGIGSRMSSQATPRSSRSSLNPVFEEDDDGFPPAPPLPPPLADLFMEMRVRAVPPPPVPPPPVPPPLAYLLTETRDDYDLDANIHGFEL